MTRSYALAAVITLAAATVLRAQAPQQPPKPGPELQKLAYFAGKWTSTGEMKPGPMGPGGKMATTTNCEWFPGGFFLVCHDEGASPGGPTQTLGILGYNGERKRYTYYVIDNGGHGDLVHGELAGDTWNWEGESLMGGQTVKHRCVNKQLAADSHTWRCEMAIGGGAWTVTSEGTSTRVK
ncbi:MAG: DUF1579 family protein [Gemmatimonadales bacterium]